MVDAVGSHICDGVELSPSERILDARELTVDLVLRAERREPVRQNIDGSHQLDPTDCGKICGVRIGHATRAENEKAHRSDFLCFLNLVLGRRQGWRGSAACYRS